MRFQRAVTYSLWKSTDPISIRQKIIVRILSNKLDAIANIDIDPEPLASFSCGYPVQKVNDCVHRYLREYDYTGSDLIYCDPPYLIETRTSKRRYRYEYSRQDHVDLLELLKSLPCRVILTGYPSALYDTMLEDWNYMELQAMTWGGPVYSA